MFETTMKSTRIEREKRVVSMMIQVYCKYKLKTKEMPAEYLDLIEYAHRRLDGCKFGEKKSACQKCPIHCYAPQKREMIREVMRWVGPRMLFISPINAIRHLLNI